MLGAELRAVRESRGFGIREVASRAGVSHEAVSAVERGARYSTLHTLERLAGVLGIRIVIGPEETTIEPDE